MKVPFDLVFLIENDISANLRDYTAVDKLNAVFEVASSTKIAELIATGRMTPVNNLNQEVVYDRVLEIQKWYRADREKFLRSVTLAVKLKEGSISREETDEWADRKKTSMSESVSAGYLADIIVDPKQRDKLRRLEWTIK